MAEVMICRGGMGGSSSSSNPASLGLKLRTIIIESNYNLIVPNDAYNNEFDVRIFGGGGGTFIYEYNAKRSFAGYGGSGWMNNALLKLNPGEVIPITIGKYGSSVSTNNYPANIRDTRSANSGGTTSFGIYLSASGGSGASHIYNSNSSYKNYIHGGNGGAGGGANGYGGHGYQFGGGAGVEKGGDGGPWGGGGGANRGNGGNGGTYGGGGGGLYGGNGGTYGGGGSSDSGTVYGKGGTYGGNGGASKTPAEDGTNTLLNFNVFEDNEIFYNGYGAHGMWYNSNESYCNFGGGGGFGGNGGWGLRGGGGGYGGKGGNGSRDIGVGGSCPAGGGGGFGSNGGNWTTGNGVDGSAGGGGYGRGADGGSWNLLSVDNNYSKINYGVCQKGGGGYYSTSLSNMNASGGGSGWYFMNNAYGYGSSSSGGNGVCVIQYYKI